ncbi:hypothetical protein KEJ17_06495 [Candidatus Bathyarchaeota archaeon]|nr:hypothetical protein [Candidatus Bathyarchaeota archaeon]
MKYIFNNAYRNVCKIAAMKKYLLLLLTAVFTVLQTFLIFLIFWIRVSFKPISINTGIYFSKTMLKFILLPSGSPGIIYATRGNMAVIVTPIRLLWIVIFSLISALYLLTAIQYRKNMNKTCRVINPGIASIGAGSFGSIISATMIMAIGCPSCTTLLFLPLVGGVLTFTLGAVVSGVSFIGLLSTTIYLGATL